MNYIFITDSTGENFSFCTEEEFTKIYSKAGWTDLKAVSEEIRQEFSGAYPIGKTLDKDNDNNPCWVDIPAPPAPSKSEQLKQLTEKYKKDVDTLNALFVSALVADDSPTDPKKDAIKQQIADLKTAYDAKVKEIISGK